MRCANCHFYNETNPKDKGGLCELKFPPWVDAKAITESTNIVGRKEGCDFGKPKEDDDL